MTGRLKVIMAGMLIGIPLFATAGAARASEPVIDVEDVTRFYEIYDASNGEPGAEALQRYIDEGSSGLRTLARLRNVTGKNIASAVASRPALYSNGKQCAEAMPRVRERLATALTILSELYPAARFPAVTVAVGKGKPVGVGGPETGVQIGLEALCAVEYLNADIEDRFVYVIAHEFVHVQQSPSFVDKKRPTVLEISLQEGVAEFVTELVAGEVAYSYFSEITAGREEEIETAFATDIDKTDVSDWVYNGTLEEPNDLGYWVGYRIAKAYYHHAADKQRALREMLEMTDAKKILNNSGWHPGIQLP